jgi:hypothetical protein
LIDSDLFLRIAAIWFLEDGYMFAFIKTTILLMVFKNVSY